MGQEANRIWKRKLALLLILGTVACAVLGCDAKNLGVQQGFIVHKDCKKYVQTYLASVFHRDYTEFMKNGGDGSNAVNLHDQMIKYFVEIVYCKYAIAKECVSDVTNAEYEVMADTMLGKVTFDIGSYKLVNGEYKVEVLVTPLVFWQLSTAFCGNKYNEYMDLISGGELAGYSQTEWQDYMYAYSAQILEGMNLVKDRVSGYGQQKAVIITVKVDDNGDYSIEDEEFYALCDYMLGLK